jgi:hypothetical protein
VLAAKAIVLGGSTFAVGLIASVAAFTLAQPRLRAGGYEPPGYPQLSLTDGTVLRAVIGAAGFLAVLALFGLGIGAALRRTAGAITVVTEPHWREWIEKYSPMTAGLAVQATKRLDALPIGPWAGLGVLAGYAAAALAAGAAVFLLRDG